MTVISIYHKVLNKDMPDAYALVYNTSIFFSYYHIGDVMVNVLASSVVDRGFEPRSNQIKDHRIGMCGFSAKHTALRDESVEESENFNHRFFVCESIHNFGQLTSWLSCTSYI